MKAVAIDLAAWKAEHGRSRETCSAEGTPAVLRICLSLKVSGQAVTSGSWTGAFESPEERWLPPWKAAMRSKSLRFLYAETQRRLRSGVRWDVGEAPDSVVEDEDLFDEWFTQEDGGTAA